jgi:hypothetical protein
MYDEIKATAEGRVRPGVDGEGTCEVGEVWPECLHEVGNGTLLACSIGRPLPPAVRLPH